VETPGTKVCQANKARGFGCEAICVFFVCHKLIGLARMLHEGNEDQGKYSKQYWSIARQIFPEFVQAHTVFFNHVNILT
jgi:hypothetical protein